MNSVTFTMKQCCLSFSFFKYLVPSLPHPLLSPCLFLFSLSLSLLFSLCFQICSLRTKARICTGFRQPTFFPVGLCIAQLVTLRAEIKWVCNSFWSWFAARRYSLCGASLLSWSADPGFPLPFPFWPAMEAGICASHFMDEDMGECRDFKLLRVLGKPEHTSTECSSKNNSFCQRGNPKTLNDA